MRLACHSAEEFKGKAFQDTALTCQEDEQAQGHLLHDGALAWRGAGEGPALAGMPPGPLVPNPLLLYTRPRVHSLPQSRKAGIEG